MIVASHTLVAFGKDRLRRIFLPVGIIAHLASLAAFLFTVDPDGKAIELELVVLFFVLSLFIYTALSFISQKIAYKRLGESEVADK